MSTKNFILFSLFSVSFVFLQTAHSHPNHMSFEDVRHDTQQLKPITINADKLSHDAKEEKQGHGDAIPCTEQQHKAMPCNKK